MKERHEEKDIKGTRSSLLDTGPSLQGPCNPVEGRGVLLRPFCSPSRWLLCFAAMVYTISRVMSALYEEVSRISEGNARR